MFVSLECLLFDDFLPDCLEYGLLGWVTSLLLYHGWLSDWFYLVLLLVLNRACCLLDV